VEVEVDGLGLSRELFTGLVLKSCFDFDFIAGI
jgi:hypothetical protein